GMPLISQNPYLIRVIILTSIFAILAASWDLLSGFTGQMNFGHALFFGMGAYTSALLNIHFAIPPWGSVPLGALAAVLTGLIIGIPCLRLKGTYLALTTMAFPIILMGIVFALPGPTGGELGISGLQRISNSLVGNYYIYIVTMLVLCTVMWKITDSHTGIIFHAIREDELAVRASGIDTTRYKLLAFCLSGFFAGLSGGMYAHYMRIAGPSTLEVSMSFTVVIWAVFGGLATIYGPIAAVFVLFPLLEFVRFWPEYRTMIFAVVVLLILLYMPEGLVPWVRDKIEKQCPRCKIRNVATRTTCRVCTAVLD
ncbi:MAG: branched-chain amino acid ABC transporter permease, partial [Deltaproteobacteria bacterium]|nr:branched-chain amino acid ABC transporter permease [Deltaproteobacteria bacterium]